MKSSILQNIENNIEKVVDAYRESPSDELYKKWLDLLGQYAKCSEELKRAQEHITNLSYHYD